MEGLFKEGEICLAYDEGNGYISGGILPTKHSLALNTIPPLKSTFFGTEREIGIINLGQEGTISIDGSNYSMSYQEVLYIGRDAHNISFSSVDVKNPAVFYLNSLPATQFFDTQKITVQEIEHSKKLCADQKSLTLIGNERVPSCQLKMGIVDVNSSTVQEEPASDSINNRDAVLLYFNIPQAKAVCHFMGEHEETRLLWLEAMQAVISPSWSIQSSTSLSDFSIVWGSSPVKPSKSSSISTTNSTQKCYQKSVDLAMT